MTKQKDEIQLELDEILKKLDNAEKDFNKKMEKFDFEGLKSKKDAEINQSEQ